VSRSGRLRRGSNNRGGRGRDRDGWSVNNNWGGSSAWLRGSESADHGDGTLGAVGVSWTTRDDCNRGGRIDSISQGTSVDRES